MTFTFFFRDIDALTKVAELMAPEAKKFKRIRIWDAGSSKGCEPFSFAILLKERLTDEEFKNIYIDTSDIDENNVFEKIISSGIYPITDLRRMPTDLFEKYFEEVNDSGYFKISQIILDKVKFHNNDLRNLLPIRKDYKLIICKNVLLHLQPNERIDVIKMFHGCLEPGGYFTTEISQELPEGADCLFEQIYPNSKIYKKID